MARHGLIVISMTASRIEAWAIEPEWSSNHWQFPRNWNNLIKFEISVLLSYQTHLLYINHSKSIYRAIHAECTTEMTSHWGSWAGCYKKRSAAGVSLIIYDCHLPWYNRFSRIDRRKRLQDVLISEIVEDSHTWSRHDCCHSRYFSCNDCWTFQDFFNLFIALFESGTPSTEWVGSPLISHAEYLDVSRNTSSGGDFPAESLAIRALSAAYFASSFSRFIFSWCCKASSSIDPSLVTLKIYPRLHSHRAILAILRASSIPLWWVPTKFIPVRFSMRTMESAFFPVNDLNACLILHQFSNNGIALMPWNSSSVGSIALKSQFPQVIAREFDDVTWWRSRKFKRFFQASGNVGFSLTTSCRLIFSAALRIGRMKVWNSSTTFSSGVAVESRTRGNSVISWEPSLLSIDASKSTMQRNL